MTVRTEIIMRCALGIRNEVPVPRTHGLSISNLARALLTWSGQLLSTIFFKIIFEEPQVILLRRFAAARALQLACIRARR